MAETEDYTEETEDYYVPSGVVTPSPSIAFSCLVSLYTNFLVVDTLKECMALTTELPLMFGLNSNSLSMQFSYRVS